jgi:hypothetical protein
MTSHNQPLPDKNPQLAIEGNIEKNDQDNLNPIDELSQPGPKHVSHFLNNIFSNMEICSKEGS